VRKTDGKEKLSIIEYQGKPLSQSLDLCCRGAVDYRWKNLKSVTFRQNAAVFNTRW